MTTAPSCGCSRHKWSRRPAASGPKSPGVVAGSQAPGTHPLGDGRVLVCNHLAAHAKTSGIDVGDMHHNGAAILSFRDGMVARYLSYFDRDRALADLGLEG